VVAFKRSGIFALTNPERFGTAQQLSYLGEKGRKLNLIASSVNTRGIRMDLDLQ
jgi:hypothetical protein